MKITEDIITEDLKYLQTVNPCILVDHGRAGNMFSMRLFDQHPEILAIGRVGYFYTGLLECFAGREKIKGDEAYHWLIHQSNFRCVVEDMTHEIEMECRGEGEDPEAPIDRPMARQILERFLAQRDFVARQDVYYAMHLAYAKATGRDVRKFKYILINDDAVTQKYGRATIDVLRTDFSEIKVIHLVRDPRANFASLRHQYTNSYGTMYPLKAGRIWKATLSNSVWLWILQYTTRGARELDHLRAQFDARNFRVVKIEEINKYFIKIMRELTRWLGVCWYEPWSDPQYTVTSMGRPWLGISAYKSYYQTNRSGPLSNEPDNKTPQFARPNPQLPDKWKNHVKRREIKFLEAVYFEELKDLRYEPQFVTRPEDKDRAILWSLFPLAGEFPRWKWFVTARKERILKDIIIKMTYFPVLFISYFLSRGRMLKMFWSGQLRTRP